MKCKDCKFWNESLDDDNGRAAYGECRRFPPTQKQTGSIVHVGRVDQSFMIDCSQFEIITHANHWCGEFVEISSDT